MKPAKYYINKTDIDFDSEDNRTYYEAIICETINEARKDTIEEIIKMYLDACNQKNLVNELNELRNTIY